MATRKRNGGILVLALVVVISIASIINPELGTLILEAGPMVAGVELPTSASLIPDFAGLLDRDGLLGRLAWFSLGAVIALAAIPPGRQVVARFRE
jgi:hypothetical protein